MLNITSTVALQNKLLFSQISVWNSIFLSGKLKSKVKSSWFNVSREAQFGRSDLWYTWNLRNGNAKFGRLKLRSDYWRHDDFFSPKLINMMKCILLRLLISSFKFDKKIFHTDISECLERPHFAAMVATLDNTNFNLHLENIFNDFLVIR